MLARMSDASQPLEYETPHRDDATPTALIACAWVFIAFGLLAAVDIAVSLINGRLNLNLGILGLFIGRGLLRRASGWRTCALAVLVIEMIALVLILILFAINLGSLPGPNVVVAGAAALAAGAFALSLWQYRVLVRPDVRALFEIASRQHLPAYTMPPR
jgi:hypothetical protein